MPSGSHALHGGRHLDVVHVGRSAAAVLESAIAVLIGRTETLHDTVERHELNYDELPHARFPRVSPRLLPL